MPANTRASPGVITGASGSRLTVSGTASRMAMPLLRSSRSMGAESTPRVGPVKGPERIWSGPVEESWLCSLHRRCCRAPSARLVLARALTS